MPFYRNRHAVFAEFADTIVKYIIGKMKEEIFSDIMCPDEYPEYKPEYKKSMSFIKEIYKLDILL